MSIGLLKACVIKLAKTNYLSSLWRKGGPPYIKAFQTFHKVIFSLVHFAKKVTFRPIYKTNFFKKGDAPPPKGCVCVKFKLPTRPSVQCRWARRLREGIEGKAGECLTEAEARDQHQPTDTARNMGPAFRGLPTFQEKPKSFAMTYPEFPPNVSK